MREKDFSNSQLKEDSIMAEKSRLQAYRSRSIPSEVGRKGRMDAKGSAPSTSLQRWAWNCVWAKVTSPLNCFCYSYANGNKTELGMPEESRQQCMTSVQWFV